MSKRAVDGILQSESFSTSTCDKLSNIDDSDLIKVGDDIISIDVMHDIFDTNVPLVVDAQYKGNQMLKKNFNSILNNCVSTGYHFFVFK